MKEIEDLIININSKVGRLVEIENLLEKLANEKPEVVEMNSNDREIILNEIRTFTNELSETLRDVFSTNLEEVKTERNLIVQSNQTLCKNLLQEINDQIEKIKNVVDSCQGLDELCKTSITQAVDMEAIKNDINHLIKTTVYNSLSKQTKDNEQAAIKLGNTAKEMRKIFKKSLHIAFVLPAMGLVLIAYIGGIGTHSLWLKKTCENVFEKFYSDRFAKEIELPLREAKKEAEKYLELEKAEAAKYLSMKKKEADEDLEKKKKEAEDFLKEKLEEARQKAQEEYNLRMELYSEEIHSAVDRKIKKANKKED